MTDNKSFLKNFKQSVADACNIDSSLFDKYDVKRGLRNNDNTGVLVGLTNIGDVVGYSRSNGELHPIPGKLFYRGVDLVDLVHGFQLEGRHGFDETVYLLLSGKLPNRDELQQFTEYMASLRDLPTPYTNSIILSMRSKNVLNMLARSVLSLYAEDPKADDISLDNTILQSLNLIAKFPTIIAYSYQALRHSYYNRTLSIRHPQEHLSTAENFLHLIKGKNSYSQLAADIIDLLLVMHAEHGGGNNSTFTVRVTSSTETDIYSAITSAICSLKGHLHGGANFKVLSMMEDIKKNVHDWENEKDVEEYLLKILNKQVGDHTGKVYGMGHAVYTISDPRTVLLKEKAAALALEAGKSDEFELYSLIDRLMPDVFRKFKGDQTSKVICPNVDFYSGFIYSCIGIPKDLYTPLFAMARVAGWCAHRIEELNFSAKRIIRPAFKNVYGRTEYTPLGMR